MIIYFLRHANAGSKKLNPKKDEKRPLDAQGIEQCGEVGRALAAMDTTVDALISSPLKRATQTAALVGNEIGYEGKLHLEKALRPEATFDQFREMLRKYSKMDAIMVVGHNPNFSEFLGKTISQRNGSAFVELKKGSVARVEKAGHHGTLEWFFTPRVVQAISAQRHQLLNPQKDTPLNTATEHASPPNHETASGGKNKNKTGGKKNAGGKKKAEGKKKRRSGKKKANRKKKNKKSAGYSASRKSSRPKTSRK